jgi:hypothetical protein
MSNELQRTDDDRRLAELSRYSPAPFLRVLSDFLAGAPSPEAIRKFAQAYPDRWATAVKALSGVAGFSTDRLAVDVGVNLDSLSDSQLRDMLSTSLAKIGEETRLRLLAEAEIVEAEAVEVPAAAGEPGATE